MRVTEGGGYGCEKEVDTSVRTWRIRVYESGGCRCTFAVYVELYKRLIYISLIPNGRVGLKTKTSAEEVFFFYP